MIETRYRVVIEGVNLPAPSDGFIDHNTVERYMADGSAPSSYNSSVAKERANRRYEFLHQALQIEANVYITDISTPGGSVDEAPSSFEFTAVVERGDGVLVTEDELNPGQVLEGEAALVRWIARSLIQSRASAPGDIYDPTETPARGYNEGVMAVRRGVRIEKIDVGALAETIENAEALITITKL